MPGGVKVSIRALLSVGVTAGFFWAYYQNPSDDMLKGALVAMATSAVNYWLGSSRGAEENREALNRSHEKLLETK